MRPIRQNGEVSFLDRYRWEQQLISSGFNDNLGKTVPEYIHLIHKIRKVAYDNHGNDYREYLLGTLVHHWWLLVRFYSVIWSEKQKERLAAVVLATWVELLSTKEESQTGNKS